MKQDQTMEKIESLAKRRGFIFQSSEIYGGFSSAYDYGPLGVELKENIKKAWWKMFVTQRNDMVGIDAAIIMNPKVWQASGHLKSFSDSLVDCKECKKRFRTDHILEVSSIKPQGDKKKVPTRRDKKLTCPECGGELTKERHFNLMFKTFVGPVEDEASVAYLRPETAGGIFTNFQNIIDTMRMRVPFGIGQMGKAFRNEVTPENYIFRTREFEQMEVEYFVHPKDWKKYFEEWLKIMKDWCKFLGVKNKNLILHEMEEKELAHYSKRTIDFEFKFPFGQKELYGLAYRTDYDLKQHQKFSGQDLSYTDPVTQEKYIPHIIEPSLGVDRSVLVTLLEAYSEVKGGRTTTTQSIKDAEVVLKLPYALAPIKVAILPLAKKDKLQKIALEIQKDLSAKYMTQYDDTGSIGKRYRRQDEIGTPYCVTVDFDSLEDKKITVRDRDSMKQDRVSIDELKGYFDEKYAD